MELDIPESSINSVSNLIAYRGLTKSDILTAERRPSGAK